MSENEASLYIHIPFCFSLCDYCDFYSVKINPCLTAGVSYIDKYINALIYDINYQLEYFSIKKIPTVYIGGGTPSLLGENVGILLDALKKIPCFSPAEFTIEANGESLTESFLSECLHGGVNRLSLGVQTFHKPSLICVNRIKPEGNFNEPCIKEKLSLAAHYFPDSLSVDLITGLPYQTEQTVRNDIKLALDFNPVHISLYSLTVEKDTLLEKKINKKEVLLPDIDIADSLWLTGRDEIIKSGFEHYEVSNFALAGKQCLHNIRYWQMQNWLGAGTAASGTIIGNAAAKRFTYKCDTDAYIKNPVIQYAIYEELDNQALLRESLLMGFRYKDGPCNNLFMQRFGKPIEELIPKTLERWKDRDKMLFLNGFLAGAFFELDN
jgi:oxygen-independent coproporphyrinogen-3 oxidase